MKRQRKRNKGNGAANGDGVEENDKSGEPLVLVRENDDSEGKKEAPKSRRRGPLGKKRKAKSDDADESGEGDAAAVSMDGGKSADGEAVHSGE